VLLFMDLQGPGRLLPPQDNVVKLYLSHKIVTGKPFVKGKDDPEVDGV
jgi:hypothetical protein